MFNTNGFAFKQNIKCFCCKPYPWFTRKTLFAWRFDAHWVIAINIPVRHGYFVFQVALRPRIMQSARDIAPLAQSIMFIVARIASWNEPYHYYGFRAPGAVSAMTRRNPKGELPLCQAIFTAGRITYPAHSGHILCLVFSRMPLKDPIIEPAYDRVWQRCHGVIKHTTDFLVIWDVMMLVTVI